MKNYPKKGTFIQKLQKKQHNLCSILLFLEYFMKQILLKSVNFNFTMAVHSPKLGQAKTQFLSHHNVCKINIFATFQTSDLWSDG